MSRIRWYGFLWIMFLLLVICEDFLPKTCLHGFILPEGDHIAIEYGDPLDLTCVLVNTTHKNGHLSFTRNGEPLPFDMIDVINSTTIKLKIENPPLVTGDQYTCLLDNQTTVCMKRISVGLKPQNVTDFSCLSNNYENLTCTWTAPQNYVPTDYSLTFGKKTTTRRTHSCPSLLSGANNSKSCFWNLLTTPNFFNLLRNNVKFTLKMNNTFGRNQINVRFHHHPHVLSSPPENLAAEIVTPTSVYLSWMVPWPTSLFSPGVHHRILYQCAFGEKKWNLGAVLTDMVPYQKVYFNLTHLQHPHTLYYIRVSLRSALITDESMWSRNASIAVRTSSEITDAPGLTTTFGSFEIVNDGRLNRDIYIYWKDIPGNKKNGPSFRYHASCVEQETVFKITNTYAMFVNLLRNRSYTFYVWAENGDVSTARLSTVIVPSETDLIKGAKNFTKVEFSEENIQFIWEAPKLPPNQYITNYTIFWCVNNEGDSFHSCTDLFDWLVVSNETTTNMKVPKNKNFKYGLAARTENNTSGILWSDCTFIHNKYMAKLKHVSVINTLERPTTVKIIWELDCKDRIDSVKGYIVYYCPVRSRIQPECLDLETNATFYGSKRSDGYINHLQLFTTYIFRVSVITKHNIFGQASDPVYYTIHGKPGSPQNLTVVNATTSTITVSWQPPVAPNPMPKFYLLSIWSPKFMPGFVGHVDGDSTSFTYEMLAAYNEYTITLGACIHYCTNITKKVCTAMGPPSKIAKPTVDSPRGTSLTIAWKKPHRPRGKNDFYVMRMRSKDNTKTFEYNTTGHTYYLDNCPDVGTYYISVKAVNIIQEKYADGPWSSELEYECPTLPITYIIYLSPVIIPVILIHIGFLYTRLRYRLQQMLDIEIQLPPGLQPIVRDHTLVLPSTNAHQSNHASHVPPYEELLLVEINQGNSNSSGCSPDRQSAAFPQNAERRISSCDSSSD